MHNAEAVVPICLVHSAQITRADAPSRGRALVSAGVAGNHRGSLVHEAYRD